MVFFILHTVFERRFLFKCSETVMKISSLSEVNSCFGATFNSFEKELDAEHIVLEELVEEPEGLTYNGGKSAQDIKDKNPQLIWK